MALAHHARIAALWLCAVGMAHAASFDCVHASSSVEKYICDTPQLSKLNDELTTAYAQALKQTLAPESLKKQQRGWLNNVRNRCDSVECLQQAYAARLKQLAAPEALTQRRSTDVSDEAADCQIVADFSNRGELQLLGVDFIKRTLSEEQIKQTFGEHAVSPYGIYSYWSVDMNLDGAPDHLLISTGGSMAVNYAYGRSGKMDSEVTEVDNPAMGDFDLSFLAVGGRYYLLTHFEDHLSQLLRMDSDGRFQKICSFARRAEPMVTLVKGKMNPLCAKVGQDLVEYVDYNLRHTIDRLPEKEIFWSKHPREGVARVDINNDGRIDNVVLVDFIHGGERNMWRGCDATYIAVTDSRRTTIPDSELNRLLLESLGGYPCGPNQSVFVDNGTAYIDAQERSGSRKIHVIKGQQAKTVCEFRGRLLHDVKED
jgi:uncharacterized protein